MNEASALRELRIERSIRLESHDERSRVVSSFAKPDSDDVLRRVERERVELIFVGA
ncbi:hypothetical protein D3C83_103490 [compost metagenome]